MIFEAVAQFAEALADDATTIALVWIGAFALVWRLMPAAPRAPARAPLRRPR